jgi:hypothetical protein
MFPPQTAPERIMHFNRGYGYMDLVHIGAAGARQDFVYELAAPFNAPMAINPNELLVVSNPVAMDAGGTFQLTVKEAHWIEARREETF